MFSIKSLFKPKFKDNDLFIGIFLKEQEGVVFYLQKRGGGLAILEQEYFQYSSGWEHLTDDVDEVLYRLEQKTRLTPNKTIIFIYSHLIDPLSKQIKKPYLSKIKEISKSLELTPLGYIECHEAVIDYLRRKGPYDSQAILVEFDKTLITVLLYNAGKLVFQKTVPRTGDVVESVTPIFEQIKEEEGVLPTKLVIYNTAALKKEASEFTSYSWSKSLFDKKPTMEIVSEEDLHTHLIELFGKQVLTEGSDVSPASTPSEAPVKSEASVDAPPMMAYEVEDDFEFEDEIEPKKQFTSESVPQKKVEGFVIGGDDQNDDMFTQDASDTQKEPYNKDLFQESQPPRSKQNKMQAFIGSTTLLFKRIMKNGSQLLKPLRSKGSGNQKLIALGVLLVCIALFIVEYFFHKATIRIMMPSQEVAKTVDITDSDLSLHTVEDTASFNAQTAATGQKNIGEKAKGSVTIYNSSLAESKTLPKGSKITSSSGGLKFILADDIKVASASGDASSITSSSAKGTIVADEIGPEYNLAAGTKFTIPGESASTVIAKNDSALTGGTKKQVKVVSQTDVANLKKSIQTQVNEYVQKAVRTKTNADENVVSQLTSYKLTQEDYTNELDQEASSTQLTAKAAITYKTFSGAKAKEVFDKLLSEGLSDGLTINDTSINYSLKKVKTDAKSSNTTLQFGITGKAITKVDKSQVQHELTGKKITSIDNLLRNDFKAKGYEFVSTSSLPILSMWLPFFRSNLTVEIVY